jgi:putative MATE family efflux protein
MLLAADIDGTRNPAPYLVCREILNCASRPAESIEFEGTPRRVWGNLMTSPSVAASPPELKEPHSQSTLDDPILPVLLRFAVPNLLQIVVQSAVAVVEVFFVSRLGTDALAGISVVFPILTLLIGVTSVGLGGAVASAIARSLGAAQRSEAEALAIQAVVIAVAFGAISTAVLVGFGPHIYRALGAKDASLDAALTYSNLFFGGAMSVWLLGVLTAIVRGTGNMVTPARVALLRAIVAVPLSAVLIFGWGPIPGFGMAGAALGMLSYYMIGVVALIVHLQSRSSILHLSLACFELRWDLLNRLLRVGTLSSLQIIVANLILAAITTLVAYFGVEALAGYGLASRLELLIFPVLLAWGVGTTTMVGTCVGAGMLERARRITLVASGLGALIFETIGLVLAIFASRLMALFSDAPDVVLAGATYLQMTGPVFGFMGLLSILFAAYQGWGRMTAPFLTSLLRLAVAIVGGGMVVQSSSPELGTVFGVIASSTVLAGLALGLLFLLKPPKLPG